MSTLPRMPIDVEAVLKLVNALGLTGAVAAYARQRFSVEGRQRRVGKQLSTLGSPELLDAAGNDSLLLDALAEQRRTLAFEAMAGFQASDGERAAILTFIRDGCGKHRYKEVNAARRLLRWEGHVYSGRTSRGDRAFNWAYRNALLGFGMLGLVLLVAGVLLGMPPSFVLTSVATAVLGVIGARQFYSEHRLQMLADDLQGYSERRAQAARTDSGRVSPPESVGADYTLPLPQGRIVHQSPNGSHQEHVGSRSESGDA